VPVRVQGDGAAREIAAAIAAVNRFAVPVDCLVVGRGGGSLEDLWAFNEEAVVRAIHASRIPVVSAVGHEIDVTLADLVADVRALTPSEAAELVVPAAEEITLALRSQQQRLLGALRRRAMLSRARLDQLAGRRLFRKPFELVHDAARRLDELSIRSLRAARRRLAAARKQADAAAGHLESLSPLGVLGRGYSLTQRLSDGQLVRDAAELSIGDEIATRFARGRVVSRVEKLDAKGEPSA
jgi:exodeoxyribonuclease VII large subunit